MKKILCVISVLLLSTFSSSTMALTEQDCRERVNNAMHNSDKLGGNDADAYRWAQNAAIECYKEAAKNRSSSASSYSDSNSSSFDVSSILIPAVILGLIGYFIAWPIISGFMEVSKKADDKPGGESKAHAEIVTDEVVNNTKITQSLRAEIIEKTKDMTVAEISEYTKSTARGTIAWLSRNNLSCKDYDKTQKK
jgi:hypothetical protein